MPFKTVTISSPPEISHTLLIRLCVKSIQINLVTFHYYEPYNAEELDIKNQKHHYLNFSFSYLPRPSNNKVIIISNTCQYF